MVAVFVNLSLETGKNLLSQDVRYCKMPHLQTHREESSSVVSENQNCCKKGVFHINGLMALSKVSTEYSGRTAEVGFSVPSYVTAQAEHPVDPIFQKAECLHFSLQSVGSFTYEENY